MYHDNFRNLRRFCLAHLLRDTESIRSDNTHLSNLAFDRSTCTYRCCDWWDAQRSALRGGKLRLSGNQARVGSPSNKCSDGSHPFDLVIFTGGTQQKRSFRSNNFKRMSTLHVVGVRVISLRWWCRAWVLALWRLKIVLECVQNVVKRELSVWFCILLQRYRQLKLEHNLYKEQFTMWLPE